MKKFLMISLIFIAGSLAGAPESQAQTYLAPAGGITVKDLGVRTDGWVLVTFAESIPELTACGTWTSGAVSYPNYMFLDMTTSTGKQVYGSLLAASLTGHKLAGVAVNIGGTNACYLIHAKISSQ